MNNSVRRITDGAMMLAIVGVFMVVDRWLGGLFGDMVLFALPLPLVFYTAKYDYKSGLMVYVALLILSVILATPQMVMYVMMESLLGLIYGTGIYHRQSSSRLLGMSIFCGCIINLITTILFAKFFGYDVMEEMEALSEVAGMIQGLNPAMLPGILRVAVVMSSLLLGLMEGYLTHVFSRVLLHRLRFDVPGPEPLSAYRPKRITGYIALVLVGLMTVSTSGSIANEFLRDLCMMLGGIGMLYLLVYGYIGISVCLKALFPHMKWAIVIIELGLIMFASMLVVLFGFLYVTTDIRERVLKEE